MKAPFPRMSYDEAVKILQAKGSEIQWGGDFGNADETLLTQDFDRPVMVDRYPTAIKAFYFQTDEQRPEVALGVDFIAPEGYGEIIGGGQRIHDLALLEKPIGRTQPSARVFRMVPGSAPFRHGSARWIRHGCGAVRRLDVRSRACSRNHSLPADALPDAAVRLRN